MASQITSVTIVYSIVCTGADRRKSKLRVAGLWQGNSPVTGEFPAQRTSNAENVSLWWRHHDIHATLTLHVCKAMSIGCLFKSLSRLTTEKPSKLYTLSHLPWTKWPPFRRRHFQRHFHEWRVFSFEFYWSLFLRSNYANPVYGVATICHQVRCLRWGHPSLFYTATSLLIFYCLIDNKSVGSGGGLTPNRHRRQAITWINDDSIHMLMHICGTGRVMSQSLTLYGGIHR